MRKKILWCGLAMCFVGCAGNKDLLSASISEAEGMGRAAKTEKIQSAAVVQGDSELAIARQLAEEGKSDAALAASVFHYNEISIPDLKKYLRSENINVRI